MAYEKGEDLQTRQTTCNAVFSDTCLSLISSNPAVHLLVLYIQTTLAKDLPQSSAILAFGLKRRSTLPASLQRDRLLPIPCRSSHSSSSHLKYDHSSNRIRVITAGNPATPLRPSLLLRTRRRGVF